MTTRSPCTERGSGEKRAPGPRSGSRRPSVGQGADDAVRLDAARPGGGRDAGARGAGSCAVPRAPMASSRWAATTRRAIAPQSTRVPGRPHRRTDADPLLRVAPRPRGRRTPVGVGPLAGRVIAFAQLKPGPAGLRVPVALTNARTGAVIRVLQDDTKRPLARMRSTRGRTCTSFQSRVAPHPHLQRAGKRRRQLQRLVGLQPLPRR
jgi:hypothetical protein